MENPTKAEQNISSIDLNKLLQVADRFIESRSFNEAITMYFGILHQVPLCAAALNGLGWIFLTVFNDYKKAEKYFLQAMEVDPQYSPAYLNYAILLNENNDFEILNETLTKALKINGIDKGLIFQEIGIMKEKKLEFDEAINAYKNSINYSLDTEHTYNMKDSIERCIEKKGLL